MTAAQKVTPNAGNGHEGPDPQGTCGDGGDACGCHQPGATGAVQVRARSAATCPQSTDTLQQRVIWPKRQQCRRGEHPPRTHLQQVGGAPAESGRLRRVATHEWSRRGNVGHRRQPAWAGGGQVQPRGSICGQDAVRTSPGAATGACRAGRASQARHREASPLGLCTGPWFPGAVASVPPTGMACTCPRWTSGLGRTCALHTLGHQELAGMGP